MSRVFEEFWRSFSRESIENSQFGHIEAQTHLADAGGVGQSRLGGKPCGSTDIESREAISLRRGELGG